MDNKDIEIKKLEVEKLKVKEGFIRTLAIILLTIGAGIGASLKFLKVPIIVYWYILGSLGFMFLGFGIMFILEIIKFKKKLREI